MKIECVKIKGFRNFKKAKINFNIKTLIIGGNDVGKTNLLYAIRLLLDRSLSEANTEPLETDFHVSLDGSQASTLEITIKLSQIEEDAVRSKLKGHISDNSETFLKYTADREHLKHSLFIGFSEADMEEIDSRYYLKHIHFRYIQSARDLNYFIRSEKRHLLSLAKDTRSEEVKASDSQKESQVKGLLSDVNSGISELSYVADATKAINDEIKKLSHHNNDYSISFEAKSINLSNYLDQLSLGATTSDRSVGLGGDGRNNQILVALWKAKSQREHDLENEAVVYCVEEPEVHLHPHQQRKLAKYLVDELPGQVLVSTHSPQITAAFRPDSIVRIYEKVGCSVAASNGCSDCIDKTWEEMGYRMSIIPAEAFFADGVLLVEGPSEVLFYNELANQLSIDLDFYNISILPVNGVDFDVFVNILDAMEIPWVLRTDNDVFKVPRSKPPQWRLAGLNRALKLAGEDEYKNCDEEIAPQDLLAEWADDSKVLNPKGIYVSKVDLENDLGESCPDALKTFADTDDIKEAIDYLQKKKALHMGHLLSNHSDALKSLAQDELSKPLKHIKDRVGERRTVVGKTSK